MSKQLFTGATALRNGFGKLGRMTAEAAEDAEHARRPSAKVEKLYRAALCRAVHGHRLHPDVQEARDLPPPDQRRRAHGALRGDAARHRGENGVTIRGSGDDGAQCAPARQTASFSRTNPTEETAMFSPDATAQGVLRTPGRTPTVSSPGANAVLRLSTASASPGRKSCPVRRGGHEREERRQDQGRPDRAAAPLVHHAYQPRPDPHADDRARQRDQRPTARGARGEHVQHQGKPPSKGGRWPVLRRRLRPPEPRT